MLFSLRATGPVVIHNADKAVEVAAAVIERADGRFLLAQRPPGKVYAGYWEFPGGKVEPGEEVEAALSRELQEELGIGVQTAYPWITRTFVYPHATVRLHFFRVVAWSDEPHAREQQEIRWQRLDEPMADPMLPANAPVLAALGLPTEYAITSAETLGVAEQLRRLDVALEHGLSLIQVRDKTLPADQRMWFAAQVIERAKRAGARVLLNADPELVRRLGADGVHFNSAALMSLGEKPARLLSAASCHTPEELARAGRLGLDFAVLGPVNPTATHPDAVGLGWERFASIARGSATPVYAIGGVDRHELGRARRAGAHGLAMIRGAWSAG